MLCREGKIAESFSRFAIEHGLSVYRGCPGPFAAFRFEEHNVESTGPPVTITTAYFLREMTSVYLDAPEDRPVKVILLPNGHLGRKGVSTARMVRRIGHFRVFGDIRHGGRLHASEPFVLRMGESCILVPFSAPTDGLKAGWEALSADLKLSVLEFAVTTREQSSMGVKLGLSASQPVDFYNLKLAFQDHVLPLLALGHWVCGSLDGTCGHREGTPCRNKQKDPYQIAKGFWKANMFRLQHSFLEGHDMPIPLQHRQTRFRLEFSTLFLTLYKVHKVAEFMTGCDNAKVTIKVSWFMQGAWPHPVRLASDKEWTDDRQRAEGRKLLELAEEMLSNHMHARKKAASIATVFPCRVECVFTRPLIAYHVQDKNKRATEEIEEHSSIIKETEWIESIESRIRSLFISRGAGPAACQSITS
ncbi:hypothetical protein HBI56_225370 [Parastagonospora nodorum]|uniref:Uncharacterized protein n=2 Tax=Phaeosphaeria nodorum (strain SN15 / ATCC MYA-4574 / FGSC 10173) TaxID=321614 RepID=A0A7U2ID05_PHANO|nr:hypothetical protein HBH56_238990 [Parastagonospora nodorum]QRD07624.1 hypothetical protein JI435_163050 [Parastagonospora nodorum SN15]KAH3921587.1 hypothetical protein HBH54_237050 [Parastagonospora nodorum]KAH3957886.1 hypothetical protein HBH51_217520 [Parastagonospora nodorum]KAH3967441.1 hypothetical protein HBH52_186750 [Parastagonospora nodorum]